MKQLDSVVDIELELTTLCNAKCSLCYRNYTSFKHHYPHNVVRPLKDVTAQLDQFPDLQWVRLVGTISEPTLYPNFHELVSYLKSRNINIEICTNGDTNTPEWWRTLATLLTADDRVYFSICGSTQAVHEVYRTNTRLSHILRNAAAFRTDNKNDYAQCIRFAYNSEDFDSPEFSAMVSQFSHVYWTETFLHKDVSTYVDASKIGVLTPPAHKINDYRFVEKLANAKFNSKVSGTPWCMSWENKSQQIDINGNVYPCYLFLEASGGAPWDGDYERIHHMEYEVCKFCDRAVIDVCNKKDLRYII